MALPTEFSTILLGFLIVGILIITTLNFILIFYFLRNYLRKRKETDSGFDYGLALAIFFMINPLGIFLKFITGFIFQSLFPVLIINFFEFLAGEFAAISIIIVLYVVENQIWLKKTHNIFTLIYIGYFIIMTIISIITQFTINSLKIPYFFLTTILFFIVPFFYFYLSAISRGDIRKFAFYFGTGFTLICMVLISGHLEKMWIQIMWFDILIIHAIEETMVIIGYSVILYSSRLLDQLNKLD